jgi:hypothetical protein
MELIGSHFAYGPGTNLEELAKAVRQGLLHQPSQVSRISSPHKDWLSCTTGAKFLLLHRHEFYLLFISLAPHLYPRPSGCLLCQPEHVMKSRFLIL